MRTLGPRPAVVAALLLVALVAAGAPAAHDRTKLPADLSVVDISEPQPYYDGWVVWKVQLQIDYYGDEPVRVGVWTWHESSKALAFWPIHDAARNGTLRLMPGDSVTVTASASHVQNVLGPGMSGSVTVMTTDGSQRTTVAVDAPRAPNGTPTAGAPNSTPPWEAQS